MALRQPGVLDFGSLGLISMMFGSAFFLMKIAAESIPVILVVFLRLFIALILIFLFLKFKSLNIKNSYKFWTNCLSLGFVANIIPFSLLTWSEQYIDSTVASIYITATPVFAVLIAHFGSHDEKFKPRTAIGILIGLSGTLFLLKDGFKAVSSENLIAQGACLLAAFCYAFSRVQTRKISDHHPVVISFGVLLCAVLEMLPFVSYNLLSGTIPFNPSLSGILAVILLGIFPTALAFILVYRLIAEVGAVFLTTTNYLVPVFGALWGYIFLSEHITSELILCFLTIVIGLWIAKGRFGRRKDV
ncbi:MAG: DMT family transporter [Hyphomicrobiales bacterium]